MNVACGSELILGKIGKTDLFSGCSAEELGVIADNCELREYVRESAVFRTGDPGDALYIVDSGEVVIRKQEANGRNIDLAVFVQGDYFGELDLLSGTSRNASAWAQEKCSLIVFPKKGTAFEDILEAHPPIAAGLLHTFIVEIAGKIRHANELIKENSPIVQELKKQIYTDKLTGLYNKVYLEEYLSEQLAGTEGSFSLLMVKPDNFKAINDTYGHDAGDAAIKILAYELKSYIKEGNLTARFMGNEMAVVLHNTGREAALKAAAGIMEFMHGISFTEATGGEEFLLSVSIGISVYPEHGENADLLIQSAHELPLIGRGRGGNQILFPEDK